MKDTYKGEECATAVKASELESALMHLREQVTFLRENYFRISRVKERIDPTIHAIQKEKDIKKQPDGFLNILNDHIREISDLNESTYLCLGELDKLV